MVYRAYLLLVVLPGIFLAAVAALVAPARPSPLCSVVSIGRTVVADGSAQFMVGVTNNTRSTMVFLVGLDMAGSSAQSASAAERHVVVVPPRSGTQVGLATAGGTLPQPLGVYFQKRPGKFGCLVRSFAARFQLWDDPGWAQAKVTVNSAPRE